MLKTRKANALVVHSEALSAQMARTARGGVEPLRRAVISMSYSALEPGTALISLPAILVAVHGSAGAVLDPAPRALDQLHHRVGHRHVIELERHLVAVLERPVEELEHFLRVLRLRRAEVHQDERGAGDRPAARA